MRPALDAPDFASKPSEERRLPTEPGPNFEHAVRRSEIESCHDLRDERGLGRHLVVRQLHRDVFVRPTGQSWRDKVRAWDGRDRVQHTLVGDPRLARGVDQISRSAH
jgi:hypothetical protein